MDQLKEATSKLNAFIDWVQWNREGRDQQIQFYKDRLSTRNKRIQEGLRKEITNLENEKPWHK